MDILFPFMSNTDCILVGYVDIASWHSSSLWACVIGVHLWRAVKGKREIEERYYHIVCWGIPLLFMIIPIGLGEIGLLLGHACYLRTTWSSDVFANGPRVLFFGFVFLTMGWVLLEMRKLRKVFAWSNNNTQKYTARRKLLLMMASFIPCAFGTVLILIVTPNTWIYFVGIYLQDFQGLANVLSTKERQIISAVSKLSKKICGRKKKSRQATILAPPEFEAGAIQIDPSSDVSDSTLPSDSFHFHC